MASCPYMLQLGQSWGTSAGGFIHGSSTKASWNQSSAKLACSVTMS